MKNEMDRRRLIRGAAGAAAAFQAARLLWPTLATAAPSQVSPIATELCALTIPATDTGGAVEAGVPAFLELAVAHGFSALPADALARIERALDAETSRRGAGPSFLAAGATRRADVLQKVDAELFATGEGRPVAQDLAFWRPLKGLIVAGYYTSEIGGSKELRYELVPGHLEITHAGPDTRAWSNDWTAVIFG